MMFKNFSTCLIISLSVLISLFSYGSTLKCVSDLPDSYSDGNFLNDNHVFQNYIKAVEISRVGFAMADPIITLNTDDRFQVCFDDLQGSIKQYYYQLIHCSANWTKSEIWTNEYIDIQGLYIPIMNSIFQTINYVLNYLVITF